MNLGLKGRTGIVTGGSRGIGKAIALELAKQGVSLTLIARNEQVLKTVLGLKDDLNNNILVFNSLTMSLRKIKIIKSLNCLNKCL